MAAQFNYYDVLEVLPTASEEAIKGAYKYLAQKWHPDKNKAPDAAGMTARLNEAYAVLSVPAYRAEYDRQLTAAPGEPEPPEAAPIPAHQPQSQPAKTFDGRVWKTALVVSFYAAIFYVGVGASVNAKVGWWAYAVALAVGFVAWYGGHRKVSRSAKS